MLNINQYLKATETIEIEDVKYSYYQQGEGEKTIVFVPSFPMPGAEYLPLANLIDKKEYRLIILNVPNWVGGSESSKESSLVETENSLERLIVKLTNNEPFFLVTYSLSSIFFRESDMKIIKHLSLSGVSDIELFLKEKRNLLILNKTVGKILPDKLIAQIFVKIIAKQVYKSGYYTKYKELFDYLYKEMNDPKIVRAINSLYTLPKFNNNDQIDYYLFAQNEPAFIEEGIRRIPDKKFEIIESESDHNHVFTKPGYSLDVIKKVFNTKT